MSDAMYLRVPPDGELPSLAPCPTRVVVIAETKCWAGWQAEVSAWLVRLGCLYMMAWGPECSSWDDSVDVANLEEFEYKDIPEDRFVMTTWHSDEPLGEVFWFSKNCATHPTVVLQRTVLFHISNQDRGLEFLNLYAEA
jgi:hypothetical protein